MIFTVIFVYSIFHFSLHHTPPKDSLYSHPPTYFVTFLFTFVFVVCVVVVAVFFLYISLLFFCWRKDSCETKSLPWAADHPLAHTIVLFIYFFFLFFILTHATHTWVSLSQGMGVRGVGFGEKETAGWLAGRLALNPAARTRPKSSSCLPFFLAFSIFF